MTSAATFASTISATFTTSTKSTTTYLPGSSAAKEQALNAAAEATEAIEAAQQEETLKVLQTIDMSALAETCAQVSEVTSATGQKRTVAVMSVEGAAKNCGSVSIRTGPKNDDGSCDQG